MNERSENVQGSTDEQNWTIALEAVEDVDNLRHMLGARPTDNKRDWGYRNYYCANLGDKSMARLEHIGLVIAGRVSGNQQYFHATEAGCKVAGLNQKQIQKAMRSD